MNDVVTASRMNMLSGCPRRHFWRYEIGMSHESVGPALHFGSAWARAMEARWLGASYGQALAAGLPENVSVDELTANKVSVLLVGFYEHYGLHEICGKIHPEVRFGPSPIARTNFVADGVMDGLGTLKDGRLAIIETKTTGDSIDRGSEFWDRLRFNIQVLQYITEAPGIGWDVDVAYYDVTRKPTIKPKEVMDLDENGKKIVLDADGNRVFVEKGKKGQKRQEPRQGGDEERGWVVKSHIETPDEFGQRLFKDTLKRPEFYFARMEIPVLIDQVNTFRRHREEVCSMIEHFRSREQGSGQEVLSNGRDAGAWPRNVAMDNCKFCSFRSFCISNVTTPDLDKLPNGFSIKPFNPELERQEQQNYDDSATEDAAATA